MTIFWFVHSASHSHIHISPSFTMLHHSYPGRRQQPTRVLYQKKTVVEEVHLTCEVSEEEDIAADMGFSEVGKTCEGRPPFLYPAPKFS